MEPVPVYSVNPDRITIAPKSSCQLEFFGFSAQPGQIEERFICTLGNGVKSKQTVFDIVARSVVNIDIVARSVVNMPLAASQQHLQPRQETCLTLSASFLLEHEHSADTSCCGEGAASAHCNMWHDAGPTLLPQCCSSQSASSTGATATLQGSLLCP